MKRIVVTGGNKGIGFAICEEILRKASDTFVYLGSRDVTRGNEAVETLLKKDESFKGRLDVLPIDVTDDASVKSAVEILKKSLGSETLYGLVNNAGVGFEAKLKTTLDVNYFGTKRVTAALAPLLHAASGRVVHISSAAAANYLTSDEASAQEKRVFLDANASEQQVDEVVRARLAKGDLDGNASACYGFSKAALNAYTLCSARANAALKVNACTPGFIATDLTKKILKEGEKPEDRGMKSPKEGTASTLHLLFDDDVSSGQYFGSDALRSPMHKYRAPGDPAYDGSDGP